tara:strand:- start:45 stop:422 length:378 start_codon:yes stop_codon:yes gene_type:complete
MYFNIHYINMNKDIHTVYELITKNNGNVEHIVYNYIKNNNINYIKNNNGLFFNLNKLTNNQLQELKYLLNKFIDDTYNYNNKLNNIIDIVNNKKIHKKEKIVKKDIPKNIFTKYQLDIIKNSKVK